MFAFSHSFLAKSSHPKKTGCTTKANPTSTTTPRSRTSKESSAAAETNGTDARINRKSDTPTSSSLPQKASTETPSQSGEVKSSFLSSDTKPLSSKASGNETEGTQAASQPGIESKSAPNASSEDTPEATVRSPHINAATEDTSFTNGEMGSCSQVETQGRTEGKGEDRRKRGETDGVVENSPR